MENCHPVILPVNRENYNRIFSDTSKPLLILFVSTKKSQYATFLEFEKAASDLQENVTMSLAALTDPYAISVAEHYQIPRSALPVMMLFHQTKTQEIHKHQL